jgi:hypothetical protein
MMHGKRSKPWFHSRDKVENDLITVEVYSRFKSFVALPCMYYQNNKFHCEWW